MTGSGSGFQIGDDATDHYERAVSVLMQPFVHAALGRAALRLGASVLDVACGTGFVARAATIIVGPAGRVAAVDVNAQMLARGRIAPAPSAPVIEWIEASALDMPFEDGEFDAVIAQQGVQFFPDLEGGLREMARVARPGGQVVATFFAPLSSNPYFAAQFTALEPAIPQAAAPLRRAFGLDPDEAQRALAACGLADVAVHEVATTVVLPPLAGFLTDHIAALPIAAAFAELSAETQRAALEKLTDALEPYRTADGGAEVPIASYVLSGRR